MAPAWARGRPCGLSGDFLPALLILRLPNDLGIQMYSFSFLAYFLLHFLEDFLNCPSPQIFLVSFQSASVGHQHWPRGPKPAPSQAAPRSCPVPLLRPSLPRPPHSVCWFPVVRLCSTGRQEGVSLGPSPRGLCGWDTGQGLAARPPTAVTGSQVPPRPLPRGAHVARGFSGL